MNFLHDIGQLGGHGLNALPGYSTLGANITNPNINYQGALNPPTPANNFNPTGAKPAAVATPHAVQGESITAPSFAATVDPQVAAQQAANQQAIDVANAALGRIPNQLGIAQANVNDQYNQQLHGLTSGLTNATNQYGQSETQNQQQYRTGQNQVNQNASQDRQSLLRLLAGMGAGGGSEAQYLVPSLVGNVAAKGLGGAAQTFGQNAQSLDTNYNLYKQQEQGQEQSLADWQKQQLNAAQSTADTNKASLLQTLAGLQSSPAAAQPFIDQINSLSGNIDNLQRFSPTFSGNAPTYTPPALSTFTPQGNQQATVQSQAQTSATPYLSLLAGLDKKQQPVF